MWVSLRERKPSGPPGLRSFQDSNSCRHVNLAGESCLLPTYPELRAAAGRANYLPTFIALRAASGRATTYLPEFAGRARRKP